MSTAELESKEAVANVTKDEVTAEDGERPQKQAKLEETSTESSATVHQLSDPVAASKVQNEAEKRLEEQKAALDGSRKGRTVFSFGYLGEGYQGLQVYAFPFYRFHLMKSCV